MCLCCSVLFSSGIFHNRNSGSTNCLCTKVPVYSVPTPDKQVALTFNCAWDIDHTDEYVEILQNYQVEATFLLRCVGRKIQ